MPIAKDQVVTLHYKLFDADSDELIESSRQEGEALVFLQGHGNIIAGIEAAVEGKEKGDTVNATLAAKDAYGERKDNATQRLSIKKYFKGMGKLKVGMQVPLTVEEGYRFVTVTKVGLKAVDVDLNHPLAGQNLRFDMEIVDLRDASAEEIQHGHVHGEGGHQH